MHGDDGKQSSVITRIDLAWNTPAYPQHKTKLRLKDATHAAGASQHDKGSEQVTVSEIFFFNPQSTDWRINEKKGWEPKAAHGPKSRPKSIVISKFSVREGKILS